MNALLRRFRREGEPLRARVMADPVAASAHPAWLLALLRTSWPSDWMQIVEANNAPPPMTLRVDLSRGSLDDYRIELANRGLGASTVPGCPAALMLEQPMAVGDLPLFREGRASVQDAGAQLAPGLLQVPENARVLDACAAPGGKTGALLEASGGHIELSAVDVDGARLARVEDNLERLGRWGQAKLIQADLTLEPSWWDRQPFDRILLDAVCSSVGVIRRHPDIKLLRRATDVGALADVQRRMLTQCLSMLRPGGRLLYSTCSVLPAENDAVIEAVLGSLPRIRVLPLVGRSPELAASIRTCNYGIQLLPGNAAGTDGFYYACVTVT
jgi:16S rRNA (cytosine967-C5)-methyltransferase